MAQPGSKQVHKSKRHNNPMAYKSGKPRLRGLNIKQLSALLEKTSTKKEKAKIQKVLESKQKIVDLKDKYNVDVTVTQL